MKYRKIEINGKNWNAVHDLEEHIPFSFTCGTKEWTTEGGYPTKEEERRDSKAGQSLNIQIHDGVVLGELSENISLPQKAVMHEFMDMEGYTVDTKSVIPFGSEPAITRNFEYLPGIVKVTTDIHVKRQIEAKNFEVDSLKITGNWKRCAVINISDATAQEEIKWIDLTPPQHSNTTTVSKSPCFLNSPLIYDSNTHFHIFLLEAEDGTRIEIGAGFDLFRWNYAEMEKENRSDKEKSELKKQKSIDIKSLHSQSSHQSRFIIKNTEEGIVIRRKIMTSDEIFEIKPQNWRFNWYMSWGPEEKIGETKKNLPAQETDIASLNSKFSILNPPPLSSSCFHAKTMKNQMKKAVRSVMNKLNKETLSLNDIAPHICTNSSHISRPGQEGLQHWDMTDIIDFWFWVNRQLLKTESKFIISPPKNSIFEELPSFRRMRE